MEGKRIDTEKGAACRIYCRLAARSGGPFCRRPTALCPPQLSPIATGASRPAVACTPSFAPLAQHSRRRRLRTDPYPPYSSVPVAPTTGVRRTTIDRHSINPPCRIRRSSIPLQQSARSAGRRKRKSRRHKCKKTRAAAYLMGGFATALFSPQRSKTVRHHGVRPAAAPERRL